jgi:DNA-binding transcriptional ArsR family regulator
MPAEGDEFLRAAEQLKQAAEPTRLRTLALLAEEPRDVGTLVRDLGLNSQPAVSHHLALMKAGRLIERRRDGKRSIYSLTDQGRALVGAVRGLIDEETAHVRAYDGKRQAPEMEG